MGRNSEADGEAACVKGGEGLGSGGSVSSNLLGSSLEYRDPPTDILHNAVIAADERATRASANWLCARSVAERL